MVQYYYNKYTVAVVTTYTEPPQTLYNEFSSAVFSGAYKAAYWNSSSGTYTVSGGQWGAYDDIKTGDRAYYLDSVDLDMMEAKNSGVAYNGIDAKLYRRRLENRGTSSYEIKGTLVQSNISAEDGTYPANGQHSDGFWYVKSTAVGPLPPGTVINQPYSTASNGGRKLVRLSNGALVAAVKRSDGVGFNLYIKDNDNALWRQLYSTNSGTLTDVALAPGNNGVFTLYSHIGNTVSASFVGVDGQSKNFLNVDKSQTAVGNVSLAIDPTNGHLHAAWTSKNSTYPNSFNIRYAKSIDGGVIWSAVEQISQNNNTTVNYFNPTIVVRNSIPFILVAYSHTNAISCLSPTITEKYNGATTWGNVRVYVGDTFVQSNPSTVVDKDGVIHVSWHGTSSDSAGYNNLYYSKSAVGGLSWSTAERILKGDSKGHYAFPSITTDKTGDIFIIFGGPKNVAKLKKGNSQWELSHVDDLLSYPSTLYEANFNGVFGNYPPTIYQKVSTSVEYIGTYTVNNAPTLTLKSPTNNQTLYENDTINISGEAYDTDKDQAVTAYYQLNSESRKVLATNISQTQIALSKQLTFKGGKLYDGDTALTGTLADGVAHTLKVWAEDSEKASSANVERTFYVVPNRAPLLSVDAVVPSGIVDADKFKISGTASDQDANSTVKVTCRINTGNAIEIYSGTGGAWEFELALSQLVVGQNTIVIEVVDNYGAKASKTVTLNKKEVKTPILQSVARYKIEPPKGSAKGVLLFIQRDEELDVKVELSMTLSGEQEQYEKLTPVNTAPVQQGVVEDTFEHEGLEAKENIILKITPSQTDLSFNHKIHLISGAVD